MGKKKKDTAEKKRAKGPGATFVEGRGFLLVLVISFLSISLIPLAIVSFITYDTTREALRENAEDKLETAAQNRARRIQRFFHDSLNDLLVLARQPIAVSLVNDLQSSFKASGMNPADYVHSPEWESVTAGRGEALGYFITMHDHYDVFIIDLDGNVLYTDRREADLGENLFTGKLSETGFAASCRKARDSMMPVFADFSKYGPSGDIPARFFVTVILDERNEARGLVAAQSSNERIDAIMRSQSGLGEGGETYLVGSDLRMRNNSILDDKPTILGDPVRTQQALKWKELYIESECPLVTQSRNAVVYKGRRGVEVLGLFKPIEIAGTKMAVITEVPTATAFKASSHIKRIVLLALLVTIAIVLIFILLVTWKINAINQDAQRKVKYLNSVPTPLHVIDRDFNLLFVNQSFAEAVGKTVEECVGKKCYELIDTKHCRTGSCRGARSMEEKKTLTADTVADWGRDAAMPIRYTVSALKDDAGRVVGAMEYMIDTTDEMQVVDLAEKVSLGDYEAKIPLRGEDDRMGAALGKMTQHLREASDERARSDWFNKGQAEVAGLVGGDRAMADMLGSVLTYLAKYVGAQVGAIFTAGEDGVLRMVGGYAYKKRKSLSNEFKVGEGLVGQAALEKEPILLTGVPEDYVEVVSGLGDARPKNILVMPLVFCGKVKGVIELGSIGGFSEQTMELMEKIAERVAIAIETMQSRDSTQRLLEQTQQQAEELQQQTEELESQQEELRAANEELEEQTQLLKESEEKLRAQQEELQVTNEELEERTESLQRQKGEIERKNRELEKTGEEIERKAEELAIASKYKSEFLANMSHELRTPLNSLLLLSETLEDNREGNLTEQQIESAAVIHRSGSDLLSLINEILDLSKIEAGRMDLSLGNVRTQDLAASARSDFQHMADEKGLRLEVEVAQGAPEKIRSDRKRVEQVLRNLISNAIKFTETGSVKVSFGRAEDGADLSRSGLQPRGALAVSVRDTGIGIPADKQKVVFEAFQQIEGGTARKYGGTGLGLSITRELVRLLGGEIRLESVPGQGSTFTVYLPIEMRKAGEAALDAAAPAEAAPAAEAWTDKQAGSAAGPVERVPDDRDGIGERDDVILVVEDDPEFAKLLLEQCRGKGLKCLVSATGEEGLELAQRFLPKAVILDIRLPGMDGWSVLEALKDDSKTRHIPVHIMSVDEATIDAQRRGAIGYLEKPVSRDELDGALRKLEDMFSRGVKNLLVVEDDDTLRKGIVKLVGNGDVHSDEASSGGEAMEKLKSRTYDCMILDLGLPDMTGFELLHELRGMEDVVIPPVIVYTGRELTREEDIELREYAESIIVKGVRSEERLLDEASLFLHRVVDRLPEKKRRIITDLHDTEGILRGRTVLLVDDDMRNVFALSRVLEQKGMDVLKAENGKKALELLEKQAGVDMVLMDIMMPVMDGYETMKKIRAQEKFRKLPIIALTAKAMKEDRDRCIEAGANDYVVKPVDVNRLLSVMRVWLYR